MVANTHSNPDNNKINVMKKIILFVLVFAFNTTCLSQMYVSSSTATTVEGGVNIEVSTYCATVPNYLGYTYTINANQINISLCYHITILLMETTSTHDLFIPTPTYSNYIVNLTIYSSTSQTECDYSTAINTSSIPLSNVSFNEIGKEVKIFPNPSKGYLQIETEYHSINYVKIYNITGQLVKVSTSLHNDISDLKEGIYLVVLETEKGKIFKKIVLQK